jgi:hypothetical protein
MNDARRDMDRLVRELQSSGFEVSRTGSGHWKVQPPEGGGCVFMSFSPRTSAFHKTMKRLKEIGYTP